MQYSGKSWKLDCSKKKGQTTIPARLRKKFRIEEGTKLEAAETAEGILLKLKKSIWYLIETGAQFATPEEMKNLLDKLREEDE